MDDARETHVQRPGHDGVPDRHLVEKWQLSKDGQVREIQIVARVHAQPQRVREFGGLDVGSEATTAFIGAPFERARKRLGLELDAIGTG